MKLECFLTPYTKIISKWIKDPNVRPETIKFIKEYIDRTFFDINHNNISGGLFLKVKERKAKINKQDLIILKAFAQQRKLLNKAKRQATVWEEIFANAMTNKGVISNIYK